MHSAPSFFPAIATFLLCCGLSFYSSLSSLSLCFPALQVGGIHVLFCPIDDQKVVKHLLLFHNKKSNIINLIKVFVSDMMMMMMMMLGRTLGI